MTTTAARSSVQKVLLHAVTDIGSKVGAGAAQNAGLAVAGIRVVISSIAAHQSLALEVTAGTLAARTFQSTSVAALGSIGRRLVRGTGPVGPRADLCGIAKPGACPADGCGPRELASRRAASFVAWITNRPRIEFASVGVATSIATAAFRAATIAVLSFFHNPVPALVAADRDDAFVIGETARLHRVATQRAAYIADRAG